MIYIELYQSITFQRDATQRTALEYDLLFLFFIYSTSSPTFNLLGRSFCPDEPLVAILGRDTSELNSSVEEMWNRRGLGSFCSESLLIGNKLEGGLIKIGAYD